MKSTTVAGQVIGWVIVHRKNLEPMQTGHRFDTKQEAVKYLGKDSPYVWEIAAVVRVGKG